MNHRTTVGAPRLLAILLAAVALAAPAAADDLGYPPVPAPPAMPAAPAMPVPSEAAPAAVDVRDSVGIIDIGAAEGVQAAAPSATLRRRCCRPQRRGRQGMWDLTLEAGLAWFEDPSGIMGLTPPAGTPTFNWGLNTLGTGGSGRFTVGYRPTARDRIEGRSMGMGADGSSVQTGRFAFSPTTGAPAVLSPAATATLESELRLWSGEINWWRQLKCNNMWRIEAVGGVRYLRLRERATARNWVGLATNSFLRNEAANRFLGGQIGAAFIVHGWRRVELSVSAKGLVGHMQNTVTETDTAIVTGGATTDASRDTANFGYGFEGEIAAIFRIWPRIGITAAYTFLFLGNVARAGNTLDFSQAMTGSLQTSTNTQSNIVHGVFVGVRVDI